MLIPFVGFGFVLASCTDDTTGHQFATDPRPTRTASTPTAVLAEPLTSTAAAPVPRPFADLVTPRGAPDRIYFALGPELWTVAPAASEPSRVFAPLTGETIVAESPSPSGDRVAVLIGGPDDTRSVRVMTPEGEVVQRFDDLPVPQPAVEPVSSPVVPLAGEATPGEGGSRATPQPQSASPAVTAMAVSLDWSPQGDRLLLGYEPGGLVALVLGSEGDGEGAVLQVLPVAAAEPARAAWSPTGENVAFVTGDDEGTPGALFIVGVEPAPGGIEQLVDGSPGLAVFGLSWLPDGRSLLFSQGDASTAHATNTDLWRIGLDGEGRRLVVSAGSAAPVADIDLFAPSPDGRAVAYTVVVPGDSGTAFHSLWIRDLGSGRSYPIAVPENIDVSELWWTSAGFVFRTLDRESQEAVPGGLFEIYRVTEDGGALPILRAMVGEATAAATPVPD